MRTTRFLTLLTLLLLWSIAATAGIDPMDARGFALDKIYDFHGVDSVSTFNGNLNVRVPIGGEYTVGDGLKYRVQLTYNSTIWDQEDITPISFSVPNYVDPMQNLGPDTSRIESVPVRWNNAGLGWNLTFGELRRGESRVETFRYSYVTPDGATHFLYDGLHGQEGNSNPAVAYTRDGTYIRMRIPAGNANDRVIETPDGVRHYFRCINGCGTAQPEFQLESMIDARSNGLYLCAPVPAAGATSKTWTLKEAINANASVRVDPCAASIIAIRTHTVTFEKSVLKMTDNARWNRWRVATVALSAFGGTAVYTFNYQPGARVLREPSQNIDWATYDPAKSLIRWNENDHTIDVDLLTSVDSPVGTNQRWQFDYFGNLESNTDALNKPYQCSTNGGSACTTAMNPDPVDHPWNEIAGRLKVLTLPTKGKIQYTYERWGYPRRSCEPPDTSPGPNVKARGPHGYNMGVTRRTADGGTTYYGGYARDPFGTSTPDDPCDGARDFVGTTIDPLGVTTLAYYSISLQNTEGWDRYEYGMPFTRKLPPTAVVQQLPPGTTANFFLSQETYQCSAGYIPANAKYNVLKTKMKEILTANACGAVKRSNWVKYEYSTPLCSGDYSGPDCLQSNRRVKDERTVYHDDLDGGVFVFGDTLRDSTTFDGHGNYRKTTVDGSFDNANFNGLADGVVTFRNYNPGLSLSQTYGSSALWLLSNFDEERITNVAGEIKSQTLFQYAADGFLTGRRTLAIGNVNPLNGLDGTDLLMLQARTVNAAGEITIKERYYGGDGPGLGVPTGSAFSPGAEQYRIDRVFVNGGEKSAAYVDGIGNEVMTISSSTVDQASGLVASTFESPDASAADQAYRDGMKTDYLYDAIGRLTEVRPITPQTQASIGYKYTTLDDGLQVEIQRPANNGSLYHAYIELDGFGRKRAERRKMPDGSFSERTFTYLANGWKQKESTANKESYANDQADDPEFFTTYGQYDAFGRPGKITQPDGREAVLVYTGARVVKRTEKVFTDKGMHDLISWEHLDRRGNLVKAIQSKDDGDGELKAIYTFDERNRLVEVSQGTQTRKFFYDKRGMLTGEKHPEITADPVYKFFDARGHHGVRLYFGQSDNELHYTYDRAERTTAIRLKKGSGFRTIKNFDYHSTNGDECGNKGFMRGKLERATRHNWVRDPAMLGTEINVDVADYFSYDGDGNVRIKTTNVARADSDPLDLRFESTYAYDLLGNVRSINYPSCTGCTGLSGMPARTVNYSFLQGRVTAVPGYVSNISYHQNGMMTEVAHQVPGGVAVRDWITVADHGMPRPKRMYTSGAVDGQGFEGDWNPLETDGLFDYDGVGNIRQIGVDNFTYDGARRLTTACIGGRGQKYQYDQYGNATKISTYTACGSSTLLKEQVNTIHLNTNRLSGHQYDVFGNLTGEGDRLYSYDALNMMTWARNTLSTPFGHSELGKIYLYDASDERVAVVDYRVPPVDLANANAPWRIRWQWTLRGLDNRVLREIERVQDSGAAPLPYRWTDDYVFANNRLITAVNVTAGLRHQHTDHLGTPRLLTDSNGVAVAVHKYYPFGEEMTLPDSDPSRLRFTGHERDNNNIRLNAQEGDLDYMHARYYNPLQGRFWSVDPKRGTPAMPQSWNLYSYVRNNPVGLVDPAGREDEAKRRQAEQARAAQQQREQKRQEIQEMRDPKKQEARGNGLNAEGTTTHAGPANYDDPACVGCLPAGQMPLQSDVAAGDDMQVAGWTMMAGIGDGYTSNVTKAWRAGARENLDESSLSYKIGYTIGKIEMLFTIVKGAAAVGRGTPAPPGAPKIPPTTVVPKGEIWH